MQSPPATRAGWPTPVIVAVGEYHIYKGARQNFLHHLKGIWYATQHPLGPSRELGSYESHQKSVEKLIREMKSRVHPE